MTFILSPSYLKSKFHNGFNNFQSFWWKVNIVRVAPRLNHVPVPNQRGRGKVKLFHVVPLAVHALVVQVGELFACLDGLYLMKIDLL